MRSKYQEALNFFKNVFVPPEIQTLSKAESVNPLFLAAKESLDDLTELVEKEDKYRWHDLRIDPNDLPEYNCAIYLVYSPTNNNYYYEARNYFYPNTKRIHLDGEKDIAWKYIEEFEDE